MTRLRRVLHRVLTWFHDEAFSRLCKNTGMLLGGDMMGTFFRMGAMAFTVRALGPKQFGILVLIQAYVKIISTLVCFNSSSAIIKFGAEALERKREDTFKGLIRLGFAIDALAAVTAAVLSISLAYWVGHWKGWPQDTIQMAMVFGISLFFQIRGTPSAILRLFDRFKLYAVQQTVSAALKFALSGIGWFMQGSLWAFVLIVLVTDVVANLILVSMAISVLLKEGVRKWWRARLEKEWPVLKFIFWTNITVTLDMPVNHFDKIIVAAVTSLEGVAVYRILQRTSQLMTTISASMRHAIFPQFSVYIANGKGYSAIRMAIRSAVILVAITLPMAVVITLLSPYWLSLVFGDQYAKEIVALGVFLILKSLSLSCSSIHPLFTAMGFVHLNVPILVFADSVYLISAWYLGGLYGILGVVLAYSTQFISIVALKAIVISSRYKNFNFEKRCEVV